MTVSNPHREALSELAGKLAAADPKHSVVLANSFVLALLAERDALRAALEEIADMLLLSPVGGDDFDRGARAARSEAAQVARLALSPRSETAPDKKEG